MFFEEFCIFSNLLSVKFLNEFLFVGFGFGLLIRVRVIEPSAGLKVHVRFWLFVDDFFLQFDVRLD